MSSDSSFSPLEAAAISLAGVVVTAVVAFVPSWAPQQETLTALLGGVITFGFMIASAIHSHGVTTAKAMKASAPAAPAPLAVVPPPPAS